MPIRSVTLRLIHSGRILCVKCKRESYRNPNAFCSVYRQYRQLFYQSSSLHLGKGSFSKRKPRINKCGRCTNCHETGGGNVMVKKKEPFNNFFTRQKQTILNMIHTCFYKYLETERFSKIWTIKNTKHRRTDRQKHHLFTLNESEGESDVSMLIVSLWHS